MSFWFETLKRSGRALLVLPLAGALAAGCSVDVGGEVETGAYDGPGVKDGVAVGKCLTELADGNFEGAQEAIAKYDGNAEYYVENYCGLLADTQELIDQVGGLISLVAGLAPGVAPAQDFRQLIEPALAPIIETVESLQGRAELVAGVDELPEITVESLPLALDLSALIDNVPADLEVNLRGRWDRTEALALAAAPAALLGVLDFVLAHKIEVDSLDIDFGSSAKIAEFAVNNPTLLALDSGRTAQVGEAKDWFIKALTAAVATQGGLLASIEAELNDGLDHSNDVVRFVDVDGDGAVSEDDQIVLKVVEDLAADIADLDGDGVDDLTPDDSTLTNPLDRVLWTDIVKLGTDLKANLEGGAALSVIDYLKGDGDVWGRLQQASIDEGYGELADIENWIALDPKAFFASPKGVRELLFAVAATTVTDGTVDANEVELVDIAIECELSYSADDWANASDTGLAADSAWRDLCGTPNPAGDSSVMLKNIAFGVTDAALDPAHFEASAYATAPSTISDVADLYATDATELAGLFLGELMFYDGIGTTDVDVPADGYIPANDPAAHNDGLLYIAMQDPGFAGVLLLDLSGAGSHAVATQSSLNELVAMVWTTYGGNLTALVDDVTASVE